MGGGWGGVDRGWGVLGQRGGHPLAPPPDSTNITTNIDELQLTLDKSIC